MVTVSGGPRTLFVWKFPKLEKEWRLRGERGLIWILHLKKRMSYVIYTSDLYVPKRNLVEFAMHGVDGAVERKKGHRIIMGAQFFRFYGEYIRYRLMENPNMELFGTIYPFGVCMICSFKSTT